MTGEQGDVSRARALDLLDQQRRRILELSDRVSAGQRALQRSTAALAWRSPAQVEFDLRLMDLQQTLARSSGALRAALAECDRARDLLQASTAVQWRGAGWEKDPVGYPGVFPR